MSRYRVPMTDGVPSHDARTSVVRIGLLGCGTVGSALIGLIARDRDRIAKRSGILLEVVAVAVRDLDRDRGAEVEPALLTTDLERVVTSDDIDVVVEVMGGLEPARSLIISALEREKPVVSANKELIASFGTELLALAAERAVPLLFEAAVGGAIPILRALRVSLAGERVRRVMGIVNGTTNYVLSEMTDAGVSYDKALSDAQDLGYAESDPSADVGGADAAAKAAILASIAFDADVRSEDVFREGIESVALADISFATRLGYVVKLLAVAELVDIAAGVPSIAVRVHPAMVPATHPLAGVRGSFNAVFIEGDGAGELMLYGRGAGGDPTASAVLGDLLDAARSLHGPHESTGGSRTRLLIHPISELRTAYYLTLDVADEPGVLADVAAVFGAHGVSIRSMEQVGLDDEARLVFITHTAREADLQATLEGLSKLAAVDRVGAILRVIGEALPG